MDNSIAIPCTSPGFEKFNEVTDVQNVLSGLYLKTVAVFNNKWQEDWKDLNRFQN